MSRLRAAGLAIVWVFVAPAVSAGGGEAATPARLAQSTQEGGHEIAGTVVSTMSVSSYTYVQVDTGDGIVWAAAPRTEVSEGDMVFLPDGSPMPGFYSPSLQRRFDMIYFASSMRVHGEGSAASVDIREHCPPGADDAADIDLSGVQRAPSGKTVAEIIEQKADLAGEEVSVRGIVVKCRSGILGKTWIHLRDGTTAADGTNDLTVTTTSTASIGSTLLVRGTVVVDRDFGYGYRYGVLVEASSIAIE
ncbi:MAG: hypothetical protein ACE5FL_00120 [Myxococcota bacterium]